MTTCTYMGGGGERGGSEVHTEQLKEKYTEDRMNLLTKWNSHFEAVYTCTKGLSLISSPAFL